MDQLKLSRRSARNKANTKVNESSLVKSIWNIMPQNLWYNLFTLIFIYQHGYILVYIIGFDYRLNKDGSDKLNISSIKWSDDSMDTMDLYRLYEFSDMLSDGLTENLLKNNMTDEERYKYSIIQIVYFLQNYLIIITVLRQINDENYFGSTQEANDLNNFIEQNEKKSISDLLEIYLIIIANKWSNIWPVDMVQVYVDIFQRVW